MPKPTGPSSCRRGSPIAAATSSSVFRFAIMSRSGFAGAMPFGVERFLVDEAVIKVAQLLFFVVQLIIWLGIQRRSDFLHALFAEDAQILEGAGGGAIGGNLGGLVPVATGVHEEIVTGLDALVHRRGVETPSAVFGLRRAIGCRKNDARRKAGKRNQTPSHRYVSVGPGRELAHKLAAIGKAITTTRKSRRREHGGSACAEWFVTWRSRDA